MSTPLDPRYPIGDFRDSGDRSAARRHELISILAGFPARFSEACVDLTEEQLATPYRDGGWTLHQLVHHVADSHMHAYLRCKFAVTEIDPVIRPYDENAWSQLPDVTMVPITVSLALLDALHTRWAAFLRALPDQAFTRPYLHPDRGPQPLALALELYAWHSQHHLAHVTQLRQKMGW